MSCYRKTGQRNILRCTAGSALAKGDILQSTEATGSRTVDNAASNTAVLGYATHAAAQGAEVLVDVLSPGDQVVVSCTGTMAESYVLKNCDISDETTLALATDTNHDFRVLGWDGKTTSECYGVFTTLEMSTPTIAI